MCVIKQVVFLRQTVEVCRQLEKAGVSFLTVHARTPAQTSGEINVDVLKDIVSSVDCPVIGNGDLKSLDECIRLQQATGCKGKHYSSSSHW